MLWHLNGLALDDFVPVPKGQPGRHFSTGHHILGNPTATYDAKYAQMTYGDHYRKKVEATLDQERQRCADVLAEQKKKAASLKTFKPLKRSPDLARRKPRYDLNELRHNQRRCAALLFGARERGAHKLPVLVQWAPKRRESYYLMSERVYNDRLLMKLRADAGDSPLNFDFADTDGNTDNLHEFQQLINKTSKDIKGLSFDTEYKDYDYDFAEGEEKRREEDGSYEAGIQGESDQGGKTTSKRSRRKVVFSDRVTESDTDAMDARSNAARSKRSSQVLHEGLDPNDIEIDFESEFPDESKSRGGRQVDSKNRGSRRSLRKSGEFGQRASSISPNRLSSPDLLSLLQGSSRHGYSSEFTSANESGGDWSPGGDGRETGDDYRSQRGSDGKTHCKHSMRQKAQDYYKKLPKLLKTAELRAKLPSKTREPKLDKIGNDADHHCMENHKTAYERALNLARFRSLPSSYSFLARNITKMNSFSYFPGLPPSEKAEQPEEGEEKLTSEKKVKPEAVLGGRDAIFGEIDMDDFYNQDDELIYFINPEELKNVVASTTTDAQSSRNEDELTSPSATTSRSNTLKRYSSLDSEADI